MVTSGNVLAAVVALLLTAAPAMADEADNFTCKGRLKADALVPLNAWINAQIGEAVAAANGLGPGGCDDACLNRLLQERVGHSERKGWTFVPGSTFVEWAKSAPAVERCHLPFRDTIYGARAYDQPWLLPFNHRIIFVLDSIKLSGRVVGLDKLDHFIREGLDHWRRMKDGATMVESMAHEVGSPHKHLQWTEYGVKGASLTGVFAYADLAAGYFGHQFWRRLLTVGAPDGYISREPGGRYTIRRPFTFADYVNDAWDETINCSTFTPALQKEVDIALAARRMQCSPTPALATLPDAKLYINPKALVSHDELKK
ncbi:MAG TPA: hypothetical protein VFV78_10780 [Vicinamibacterales bacterium]|nr:hypothetical protein [Vicinamibacterales bacterium]